MLSRSFEEMESKSKMKECRLGSKVRGRSCAGGHDARGEAPRDGEGVEGVRAPRLLPRGQLGRGAGVPDRRFRILIPGSWFSV